MVAILSVSKAHVAATMAFVEAIAGTIFFTTPWNKTFKSLEYANSKLINLANNAINSCRQRMHTWVREYVIQVILNCSPRFTACTWKSQKVNSRLPNTTLKQIKSKNKNPRMKTIIGSWRIALWKTLSDWGRIVEYNKARILCNEPMAYIYTRTKSPPDHISTSYAQGYLRQKTLLVDPAVVKNIHLKYSTIEFAGPVTWHSVHATYLVSKLVKCCIHSQTGYITPRQ